MATDPNYQSDEEILMRLHTHIGEALAKDTRPARITRRTEEASELIMVLAERIYAEPEHWGLGHIPGVLRDDVAHDTLLTLIQDGSGVGDRGNAAEWFATQAERRFQELWLKAGDKGALQAPLPEPATADEQVTEKDLEDASALLDATEGPWALFEQQFPRDGFVLRLRYILNRSPDEMTIMLDTSSSSAIRSRLSRARSRMRMFLEQSGYDRTTVGALLQQFGGGQAEEEV